MAVRKPWNAQTHVIFFGLTGPGRSFFKLFNGILGAVEKKLEYRIDSTIRLFHLARNGAEGLGGGTRNDAVTNLQNGFSTGAESVKTNGLKRFGLLESAQAFLRGIHDDPTPVGNQARDFRQDTFLSEHYAPGISRRKTQGFLLYTNQC